MSSSPTAAAPLPRLASRWPALACGAVLIAITWLKLDTLHDPHYWDAIQGVIAPAIDSFDHGFRAIHAPQLNFGHPPLLPLTLAALWSVCGVSLVVSHVFILLLGLAGLVLTYRLARVYGDAWVAIGAVVLLAFSQMFFAQIGLLNDAIPLLTLSVAVVDAYVRRQRWYFGVSAALLVLTKETGAALLVAVVLHATLEVWLARRRLTRRDQLALLGWASPLLLLALWLGYQKLMIGWAFNRDHLPPLAILSQGKLRLLRYVAGRSWVDFTRYFLIDRTDYNVNRGHIVLTLLIGLAVVRRRCRPSLVRLCLLATGAHALLFAATMNLPRYFVPILPFYYILAASAARALLTTDRLHAVPYLTLVAAMAIGFATNYTGKRDSAGFLLETNLEYRDAIATHVAAARFLEANYADAPIVTVWPMTDELSEPRLGYVRRPLHVALEHVPPGSQFVVYRSLQSANPSFPREVLLRDLDLVQRFEQNGKVSEIYRSRFIAPGGERSRPAGAPPPRRGGG